MKYGEGDVFEYTGTKRFRIEIVEVTNRRWDKFKCVVLEGARDVGKTWYKSEDYLDDKKRKQALERK